MNHPESDVRLRPGASPKDRIDPTPPLFRCIEQKQGCLGGKTVRKCSEKVAPSGRAQSTYAAPRDLCMSLQRGAFVSTLGEPKSLDLVLTWRNSQNSVPESRAAAGSVKTHAAAICESWKAAARSCFAAMVPATARAQHVRGTDRQAKVVCGEDRRHRDKFGRSSLRVGQVFFAYLLADCNHNALPADHGAHSQRQGHSNLYPSRNELGRLVYLALVVGQCCALIGVKAGFLAFCIRRIASLATYMSLRTLVWRLPGTSLNSR